MDQPRAKILSTGMHMPKRVMTNFDLSELVDTTDEWIFERTGIKERRISNPDGGEYPSDLGTEAARQAIERAKMEPNDIDMIIFATLTPDYKMPSTACVVQRKLGITNNCCAVDIAAACSGFVYGLNMADSLIKTKMAKNILVIGAEMLSREIDWSDRAACILFGDGAGAAVVSKTDKGEESQILSSHWGSDSSGLEFLHQQVGGSVEPITSDHLANNSHFISMKGKEMFKVATRTLADCAKIALDKANMTLEQVDWIVPHQANIRIIETTAKLLGASMDKMIINIDKYGNTSAGTIPIALNEAIQDGRIQRGNIVLLDAFGAGLTFGSTLIRY